MDVITVEPNSNFAWIFALTGIGVSCFLLAYYKFKKTPSNKLLSFQILSSILTFGSIVLLFFLVISDMSQKYNGEREARIDEIAYKYGLQLTKSQFDELEYPSKEPTSDFEVFGSLKIEGLPQGHQFDNGEVILIWTDGKLQLNKLSPKDIIATEVPSFPGR